MTATDQIMVAAEDIESDIRRDPRNCAVAVAIRRQLGVGSVVTGASLELDWTTGPIAPRRSSPTGVGLR